MHDGLCLEILNPDQWCVMKVIFDYPKCGAEVVLQSFRSL